MNKRDFAASIVHQFTKFHSEYIIGGRSVSISACDLEKAKNVAGAVEKLAENLSNILAIETTDAISEEQAVVNSFIKEKVKDLLLSSRYYCQTFMHEQAVDVLDFARNLSAHCEKMRAEIQLIYGDLPKTSITKVLTEKIELIQANCWEIEIVASEYVIANNLSGADYQFSTGTSIFLPWTRLALDLVNDLYKELAFCKTIGKSWLNFIDKYTNATLRIKEETMLGKNMPCLAFSGHKEHGGKDVSAKEVGGRQHGDRDVSAKDLSDRESAAKPGSEAFYACFGRVRNYPINPKEYSRTK